MTTYFVSADIGSNTDAGTLDTAPLATLQAAANLVKAGDTVEVMNGTYTASPGSNLLQISTSGTAAAPITFEAAPGQTPVVNSSGAWNAILVQASYITINGFTVVGDAANYTLSQALALYSESNANVDGNGIYVTSPGAGVVPNHDIIENIGRAMPTAASRSPARWLRIRLRAFTPPSAEISLMTTRIWSMIFSLVPSPMAKE